MGQFDFFSRGLMRRSRPLSAPRTQDTTVLTLPLGNLKCSRFNFEFFVNSEPSQASSPCAPLPLRGAGTKDGYSNVAEFSPLMRKKDLF